MTDEGSTTPWPPITYWAKVAAAVIAVALAFQLVGNLKDVFMVVGVSLVLAIAMQPAVERLVGRGFKRWVAIVSLLIAALVAVTALGLLIVPTIATEISRLITSLPDLLDRFASEGGWLAEAIQRIDVEQLQSMGGAVAGFAFELATSIGNAALLGLVVLVLTPSFAYNFPSIKTWAVRLLRRERREDFLFILSRSTDHVAHYMIGNLAVSVLAGVTSYIVLSLLGVPYALALATFIAVMDLIPAVGAIIGAAVAVVVAFSSGVPQAIGTAAFLLGYQQLENHVIVPRVMKKAIDLSPAAVIIAILIGGKLAGVVGVLVALPVAATIKLLLNELVLPDRIESVRANDAADGPRKSFKLRGGQPGTRPLP